MINVGAKSIPFVHSIWHVSLPKTQTASARRFTKSSLDEASVPRRNPIRASLTILSGPNNLPLVPLPSSSLLS